jgi:hypothetical protein
MIKMQCRNCASAADPSQSLCSTCVHSLGNDDQRHALELEESAAALEAACLRASPDRTSAQPAAIAEHAESEARALLANANESANSADRELANASDRLASAEADEKHLALCAASEYILASTLSSNRASLAHIAENTEAHASSLRHRSMLFHAFVLDVAPPSYAPSSPAACVNNMRLCGKSVPWREANAAWGHLALLLSALQAKTPSSVGSKFFSVDVLPTGSQATLVHRVHVPAGPNSFQQQKHSHVLAGPPRLFSSAFDRAVSTLSLCTAEIACAACACDRHAGRRPAFSLPNAIESNGAVVGGRQLKLSDGAERFASAVQMLVSNLMHLQSWFAYMQPLHDEDSR